MTATFELGSGAGTNFSFGPQGAQPGASITGTVVDMKEVQRNNFETNKPEFWDNGDPKMQFRVTLQTQLRDPDKPNDDGKRELYLDGRKKPNDNGTKSRICAVLDAVRATTGGTALAAGGQLTVTWVSGMGFSGDPRNYTATYQPPAMDLSQQGQTQPVQQVAQQPVQQYQQPAPVQQQAYQPPVQPPVQQPPVQQPPVQQPVQQQPPAAGPTPEQIAGLLANRTDPRMVYPTYQLTPEQAQQVASWTPAQV
jgi:hypothetical protein